MSNTRIAFLTLRYDPRILARAIRAMRESGLGLRSKNDAVCKCIMAVASQDTGPEILLEEALSYIHSVFEGYNPCPGGALRPSLLEALRVEDATHVSADQGSASSEDPLPTETEIFNAIKRMELGIKD